MTGPVNEFYRFPPRDGAPAGRTRTGRGAPHEPPIVGVIYNPRSHRNRGADLEVAERPNVHLAQPEGREAIAEALADFASRGIDYLIVNGGDGTVRDVLTAAQRVFGDDWPALAVLPKGKTNALNVDLGAPAGWNLCDAIDAFPSGKRVLRRPLAITPVEGGVDPMLGFIMGAGGFTLGVRAGQDAHRMGAFDSMAVGVTTAWGVLRGLFGSDGNVWRRGVAMDILLGAAREPMPHSGAGYDGRRSVMLASTLERFPVGLKLFGDLSEGLKVMALDRPHRRLLAMMPLIMAGRSPVDRARWGMHQHAVESFEFALEDDFILDGEAFRGGRFKVESGPELHFVVP